MYTYGIFLEKPYASQADDDIAGSSRSFTFAERFLLHSLWICNWIDLRYHLRIPICRRLLAVCNLQRRT